MNQIVNTLITALGMSRRGQTATDLNAAKPAPMVELDVAKCLLIIGGDGEDTGPRGGWKAVATSITA